MGRDVGEVFLDHLLHFVNVDVADDRQHGIVWRVVSFEKTTNVFDRCGVDLSQFAVTIVRVVPIGECVLPQTDPFEQLIRLIEHVDANFFTHHGLLVLQVLCADVERAHAI